MDSNGFKALAFLHFYLCGVVAAFSGYHDGHAGFATIIASAVLLTTGVLSALWVHEWRERREEQEQEPRAFDAGAARGAVMIGWLSLAFTVATQSYSIAYAGYLVILVLLLYRARTMELEENGDRARLRLEV